MSNKTIKHIICRPHNDDNEEDKMQGANNEAKSTTCVDVADDV